MSVFKKKKKQRLVYETRTSPSEQQTVPPVRSVLSDGTLRGSDTFFLFLFWCTCIWVATAKADAGGGGG